MSKSPEDPPRDPTAPKSRTLLDLPPQVQSKPSVSTVAARQDVPSRPTFVHLPLKVLRLVAQAAWVNYKAYANFIAKRAKDEPLDVVY
ncbi:hypothetical protein JCM10295v2_004311 [Rhodotorula toruloides]